MQTITVEIDDTHVTVKEGVSAKNKPYRIREQSCIVHGCGRFPQESKIRVPDGTEFYAPGMYEPRNLVSVGRFGFEIDRDHYLVPVSAKQAAKAA